MKVPWPSAAGWPYVGLTWHLLKILGRRTRLRYFLVRYEAAQIAKDGLAACRPILEVLGRLTLAFPEASSAFLKDPKT